MSGNSALHQALSGHEKIVILAPHPDDETLACGGLLARAFADAGAHVICLTDGSASHPSSVNWPSARLAAERHIELIKAVEILGGTADDVTWLGLPDSRLHVVAETEVLAALTEVIDRHKAKHVFVPAREDKHCDHQTTAQHAETLREKRPDLHFHSYPVWSRWDDPGFAQNTARYDPVRLNTSAVRKTKIAGIRAHRSQLGQIVQDAPDGFVLPEAMVDLFALNDEIFWRMP
ncbi:PIG-L deacetylase family protein [Sulfitobacter dubius]|uniref:PIG-L deacetylase family protein n=1 Tax=Sulfitobacter dubius TaxID=218673 RepID=UPI0008E9448F|nr:PIG-L family deacetylase [Sulfitobacter dubius]SFH32033.1 N-acetylglucosaminyl deacetylase, LmbE family [Sulfitobacter dubius]